MPQQESKIKAQTTRPILFVPITMTLFTKKTLQVKQNSDALDFHLDIINKIDKILAEHQPETTPVESFPVPPLNPPSPPAPIEPRPPLNKAFPHQEAGWEPSSEEQRAVSPIIPEEFKTEISFNPEFRFITGHEFIETISQIQQSPENRVEIIDFNTLIKDDSGFHKTPDTTSLKNPRKQKEISPFQHIRFDDNQHHNKIEIIDTRSLQQKTYENVLRASEEQSEKIDKKAQLYFINNKDSIQRKQQNLDISQTTIPDSLEEQSLELKKKLAEEEKKLKQLELEYEKLEKMKKKKTTHPEKKQLSTEKEKTTPKKEHQSTKSKHDLKKQEKEQKKLKHLQIRQARIEERRRKKLEKQALKLKQKQQRLKMKGTKQQKTSKTETTPNSMDTPLLFDEDLIKVLHMTDSLLGELPEDILTDFIESKDYKLYEKVMNKYKIK